MGPPDCSAAWPECSAAWNMEPPETRQEVIGGRAIKEEDRTVALSISGACCNRATIACTIMRSPCGVRPRMYVRHGCRPLYCKYFKFCSF